MIGCGRAGGAATILNAVANWKGSAFGIGLMTYAQVELDHTGTIRGDVPGLDTRLIETCVAMVLERLGYSYGAVVRTKSDIPVASGLKSSSTAANATVLATLDALQEDMDPIEAAKIGVAAARKAGVTITGALDDALASMLGGVVVTDNREMQLMKREELDTPVVILSPDRKLFSGETSVSRSRLISPVADVVYDLAMRGDYGRAMTINGLAYCAALGLSAEPVLLALQAGARGASLSGTGPSYAAIIDESKVEELEAAWKPLGGKVIRTYSNNKGASKGEGT
ncbi:MAG: shikimate kinase [Methanosaeta sp. ASP1-1]|jgi:shikimate kinase|nr:shikimate kinase [Methanothrix sp.]OYV08329.1 MAG: shikimate kinase [Methanosaeta sp. ASP1-1]OYV13761.1 MAG: shikimate kinase [Methanosaeta sp. NSM2]